MGKRLIARHPRQARPGGERIIIVGTGETAAVAFEYFRHDSPHEVVAFSAEEPFVTHGTHCGLPVVPFEELASAYPAAEHGVFVAVAFTQLNRVRRRLYHAVKAAGFDCVSYASSDAVIGPDVKIGENSFVQEHVVVQYGARLAPTSFWAAAPAWATGASWRTTATWAHMSPSATAAGWDAPPSSAPAAASRRVSRLPEDCIIGAGAVILKDTAAREVYLGNPARPVGRDSFETFGVTGG